MLFVCSFYKSHSFTNRLDDLRHQKCYPVKLYRYLCAPTYQNNSRTSLIEEKRSSFRIIFDKNQYCDSALVYLLKNVLLEPCSLVHIQFFRSSQEKNKGFFSYNNGILRNPPLTSHYDIWMQKIFPSQLTELP